jgi:GTP-binding protein
MFYRGTKINIVDTPGHADFGSEVERVIRSIDSVLLVVDAGEGPMPQTKFVLKKSLELGLKPIVILNKIDRADARIPEVHDMVLELFMDLGANDEQLDFVTVYTIATKGIAKAFLEDTAKDLTPLFETILSSVSPAKSDTKAPLRMQPFNLAYDDHLGRLAIGRIYEGIITVGQKVVIQDTSLNKRFARVTKLYTFNGFAKESVELASAGDIVMVAGIMDIDIGETICQDENQEPLPAISIDEPTISLDLLVNNSPLAGRDGKFVTNGQIKERLQKELEVNVGLSVDFSKTTHYGVYGRGEMHIAILLENMRREGYEIQVSQPQVIIKEVDGERCEPFEEVTTDVPGDFSGTVIEKLSRRRGKMIHMHQIGNTTRMVFEIPTRGLWGYRGEFVVDTRGNGILSSEVIGFKKYVGEIEKHATGSMVSMATGKSLGFSLFNLQMRGDLYIGPNEDVYEGMVIGNASKGNDMAVNPTKGKQLTNMRASGSDEAINLTPPIPLTIERGLEIMHDDEYLEVTPKFVRLRKQVLKENDRLRGR